MRVATLLPLALLLLVSACKEPEADDGTGLAERFGHTRLQIRNDNGEELNLKVYLARTPEQQRRGLMYVRELPELTGMLFIYDRPGIQSMWMKNTYIPLDLVFVRADGSVSSIIANAAPLTLTSRSSREPVRYVLELGGGVAARLGIGTKSRLFFSGLNDGDTS